MFFISCGIVWNLILFNKNNIKAVVYISFSGGNEI